MGELREERFLAADSVGLIVVETDGQRVLQQDVAGIHRATGGKQLRRVGRQRSPMTATGTCRRTLAARVTPPFELEYRLARPANGPVGAGPRHSRFTIGRVRGFVRPVSRRDRAARADPALPTAAFRRVFETARLPKIIDLDGRVLEMNGARRH